MVLVSAHLKNPGLPRGLARPLGSTEALVNLDELLKEGNAIQPGTWARGELFELVSGLLEGAETDRAVGGDREVDPPRTSIARARGEERGARPIALTTACGGVRPFSGRIALELDWQRGGSRREPGHGIARPPRFKQKPTAKIPNRVALAILLGQTLDLGQRVERLPLANERGDAVEPLLGLRPSGHQQQNPDPERNASQYPTKLSTGWAAMRSVGE